MKRMCVSGGSERERERGGERDVQTVKYSACVIVS